MKRCPSCTYKTILPRVKYCFADGLLLVETPGDCAGCGEPLQVVDKFCSFCGFPVPTPDVVTP